MGTPAVPLRTDSGSLHRRSNSGGGMQSSECASLIPHSLVKTSTQQACAPSKPSGTEQPTDPHGSSPFLMFECLSLLPSGGSSAPQASSNDSANAQGARLHSHAFASRIGCILPPSRGLCLEAQLSRTQSWA